MIAVSNSSPLIALAQIGQIDLLQRLFESVWIPEAVAREAASSISGSGWIAIQPVQALHPRTLLPSLALGEQEAISLAVEIRDALVILDDGAARALAQALHLPVVGTAGLLVIAKERGLISAVQPHLDALISNRFFLSRQVYELILRKAGER